MERKAEKLTIRFPFDRNSGYFFYAWRPESGNSLYAMPETGEEVSLLFPDKDEKNAYAINCYSSGMQESVDIKSLELSPQKQYRLTPQQILFENNHRLAVARPLVSLKSQEKNFNYFR